MQSNVYYDLVKKNPAWFIKHCRLGGFKFAVENNKLTVAPAHAIDEEMAILIRTHKTELIKIIQSECNSPIPIIHETTV